MDWRSAALARQALEDIIMNDLPEYSLSQTPTQPAPTPPNGPAPARRGWLRGSRKAWVAALALAGLVTVGVVGCSADTAANGTVLANSSAAPTVAVPPSATDLQQTVVNVISTVSPSVVQITSSGGSQSGTAIGSGEILTADGYIVTNDHVVTGFNSFKVQLSNSNTYSATLKGEAPDNDLAVLKINATGLRPIAFADSSKLQVGQFAIAVGSPLGLTQSATFGIVSALNRTAQEGQGGPAAQLSGLIQTSAPINPGNSGGALVDLQGRLIGIPTLGAVNTETGTAADGIGFAIPSNTVQTISQQVIKSGSIAPTGRPFLGIEGEDVTPALAAANGLPVQSGVLITNFVADANGKNPAQQAGMQVGDIITKVDGTSVSNSSDLSDVLLSHKPGDKVTVTIVRNGNTQNVTVTLGTRPANT
jgi:S1-C subfamily serine protease